MTSGGDGRLGLVVVNFGSSSLLADNLAAVDRAGLAERGTPTTVVVVDNPTDRSERESVRDLARRWSWDVVEPTENVGFGGGMNRGVERALELGCEVVALLNPDVSIGTEAVSVLMSEVRSAPRTLVTPRLVREDGRLWFAGGQLDRHRGVTSTRPDRRQTDPDRWLTGACLFVSGELWNDCGGFDDGYFLYWEDVDLSRRVLAAGGELRVVHEIEATHEVGATQGANGKSTTYAFHMCRNRLRFAARHLSLAERLRWVLWAPGYAWRIATGDGRGALLRRPSLGVSAIAGTASGVGQVLRSLVIT